MSDVSGTQIVSLGRGRFVAFCCAVPTANSCYLQPITAFVAWSFSVQLAWTGLSLHLDPVGYVIGFVFIVPLSNVAERRRLLATMFACNVVALMLASESRVPVMFRTASLAIGLAAKAVMVLLATVDAYAPESDRGKHLASVMPGLLLGYWPAHCRGRCASSRHMARDMRVRRGCRCVASCRAVVSIAVGGKVGDSELWKPPGIADPLVVSEPLLGRRALFSALRHELSFSPGHSLGMLLAGVVILDIGVMRLQVTHQPGIYWPASQAWGITTLFYRRWFYGRQGFARNQSRLIHKV